MSGTEKPLLRYHQLSPAASQAERSSNIIPDDFSTSSLLCAAPCRTEGNLACSLSPESGGKLQLFRVYEHQRHRTAVIMSEYGESTGYENKVQGTRGKWAYSDNDENCSIVFYDAKHKTSYYFSDICRDK